MSEQANHVWDWNEKASRFMWLEKDGHVQAPVPLPGVREDYFSAYNRAARTYGIATFRAGAAA